MEVGLTPPSTPPPSNPPPPPPPAWQLAINVATPGGDTFRYNAALWTASPATPFGNGNDDTLTSAFTSVLVNSVRFVFNGVTKDYALQASHAGKYTLQQLSNGRSGLSSLVATSSAGNADGILLMSQPPASVASDSFSLGASSFPEAATAPNGLFKECGVGFDMRREYVPAETGAKVRIGMVLDEWQTANTNCGARDLMSASDHILDRRPLEGGLRPSSCRPGQRYMYAEKSPPCWAA